MAGRLVRKLAERDCYSLGEKDTLKTTSEALAKNNLGAAYLASSRWDDAIKVYQELVGNIMYGTPGNGHNNLVNIQFLVGR